MNILIQVLSLLLSGSYVAAQESDLLQILFDSSDVVVQGTIASKHCIGYAYGVEECSYKIDVDSIYKGNPKLYIHDIVIGYKNQKERANAMKMIYLKRQCFSGENCLGRNEKVILFLKRITAREAKSEGYELTDRWLGMHLYNWNLATEVGRISLVPKE